MTDQKQQTTEAEELRIEESFKELMSAYLASNHRRKVEKIEKAYRFAKAAHKGVRRRSGEPYILHPIAVAKIVLTELGLGSTSICAALLHDVVEDTEFTREDIEANFGPKIAGIVEGMTKISGGIFGDRASLQAENFRKLLLSMSTDIRVVLIKMADRLHNMRTLGFMRPEKQIKIAGETLYVYAPLAHRLGLYKIKSELENLAFRYEHPKTYAEIMSKVEESAGHRNDIVEQFVAPVRAKLDAAGYKYEIKARVKSAYSIFRKMEKKQISFDEIYDIYAIRVIFENDDDEKERVRCWEIYTFFSDGHKVHPERIRDWTSVPKANGYRALHLTAMGPDGKWIEVQIRSRKMDDIAELGYAAHWKYKAGVSEDDTELDRWMNTIKDILANPEPNAIDFLDTIKLNLFSPDIYVFTPRGDLKTLPSGATVLDLAYDIHTQLGEHCIAGKINHRLVPLNHELGSGDQVEIITSQTQSPKREWMEFCHTARARNCIRATLRKDRTTLAEHGRKVFEDFMKREGIPVSPELMERLLKGYNLESTEDFYVMLAGDEISLSPARMKAADKKRASMFKKLLRNPFALRRSDTAAKSDSQKTSETKKRKKGDGEEVREVINRRQVYVLLPSTAGTNYRIDECCNPVPGDDVIGFVDENEEVVVHKVTCPKAMRLKSSYGDRIVSTRWGGLAELFTAYIAIEGIDRIGILEDITSVLTNRLKVNIRSLNITAQNEVFTCELSLLVDSTVTLSKIMKNIKQIKGVKIVRRKS